jgi:glycerol-3-phosphate dehydrogenase (NAD(P)+)
MNMVAEGVRSSRAILGLAERVGVDMPIAQWVVAVTQHGMDPHLLVEQLMSRSAKPEIYGIDV